MLAEKLPLSVAVLFLAPALGGGVIVIEPRFSDGANAWVSRKRRQLRTGIIGCLMDIAGMDADAGMHCGILGDGKIGVEVLQSRHQSDHSGDTNLAGAAEDFRNFLGGKSVGGEVAVGIG
jgi:hypothetical protein